MIKRKDDVVVATMKELQKGKGEVTFHHFLEKDESYGIGRIFSKLVIKPGNSIGYHTHSGEFETIYILQGRAQLTDDGEIYELAAGDVNICQEGHSHGIENVGNEELVAIALIMNVDSQQDK